ncbi:MAG TPA: CDP-alcohol phosphatidyltransferase family protein [Azospirillaceae bacterium]|nr:CDP-alcohol phosphatidyltransferase family protein [Azospirillaceae bacterium]
MSAVENNMPVKPAARILGDGPARLWGMAPAERLRRSLVRAGLTDVAAWTGTAPAGPALLLRGDFVYDEVLVKDLAASPATLLTDPLTGLVVAGHVAAEDVPALVEAIGKAPGDLAHRCRVVGPGELSSTYNNALRKREAPYLLLLTPENAPDLEKRMFAGSYKGVTDLVTKHVWPLPARYVTKVCAVLGISPNMVTLASFLLVLAAFWLFLQGQFIPGLICAWGMTFLDTVDGKLARVTLTSSKWGNVFDHGTDLIHPPFWWWAWVAGLSAVGMELEHPWLVLAIVLGGYVLQRVQEGMFIALFKIEMHIWRPFDSWFRLITARRNPNLLILTVAALLGRPDVGMEAVAVWTLLCFLVHGWQIVQAAAAKRHGPIESWLKK